MSILDDTWGWLVNTSANITWPSKKLLTDAEKDELAKYLASGYYIILTGENGRLSSLAVQIATYALLGYWSPYSHCLMNCDMVSDPSQRSQFKFMQATTVGVGYATFDDIFNNSDYVCLLTPKKIQNDQWSSVIDALIEENGKPYDDLFNLADSTKVSCVECVLDAFKALPDFDKVFGALERMIQHKSNLVPAMYRACPNFEIAYETGKLGYEPRFKGTFHKGHGKRR